MSQRLVGQTDKQSCPEDATPSALEAVDKEQAGSLNATEESQVPQSIINHVDLNEMTGGQSMQEPSGSSSRRKRPKEDVEVQKDTKTRRKQMQGKAKRPRKKSKKGKFKAKTTVTLPPPSGFEDEDADWECLVCGEIYSDAKSEPWIQCTSCARWAHDSCATVDETDTDFICDLCA